MDDQRSTPEMKFESFTHVDFQNKFPRQMQTKNQSNF